MRLVLRVAGAGLRYVRRAKAKKATRAISRVELTKYFRGYRTTKDFLSYFRARKKPLFFLDKTDTESLRGILTHSKEIIEDANKICAHYFDLLGSGKANVDIQAGKIDWHKDFKSGERWEPRVLYTDTIIVRGNGSDIKVPWELSRFQHLPTLGKAYWLTSDEKYATEFVNEISDWIDSNPPQYGVNWTCTMDIAIRAVNWIWGYELFKNSPQITDELLAKSLRSLIIHARHIAVNLERTSRLTELASDLLIHREFNVGTLKPAWRGTNSNHYLSDIVGLVYLGVIFPEFKDAKKWSDFGIKELISEMEGQVYPDGVDYEGSISYHRLVTELFLSATLLCLKNGMTFPKWYIERLEKMIEFVMHYTKPDGTAPQIGDNDDGRLHIVANYGDWNRLDHRYLLSVGAVAFNRADLKQAAGEFHEEAFWLLGKEGLKKFNELPDQKASTDSKALPNGGFYIMRRDSLYMIVDCVPTDPRSPSGHKHNSRLSFELFAYDKSFIIDPGAYIYTADRDMRNLFRSTKYHNTVTVDSEEQSRIDRNELFGMGLDATVTVTKWEVSEEYDILSAEHRGYLRLKYPIIHRRDILFNKKDGYWIVKDVLLGKGTHQYDLYFHLSPLDIEFDKEFPFVIKTKTEGANLAIIPVEIEGLSVEVSRGWVSYRYGVKAEAPIIKYSKDGIAPACFCSILYPYLGRVDIIKIIKEAMKSGNRLLGSEW
jgi:hypothetical protein